MICNECNSKNNKNANFCSNCGNNLIEKTKVEINNFKTIIKNICNDLKGIIVKPVDITQKFITEDNYMIGLLYLGINIIIMSVLTLLCLDSIYNIFSAFYNYDIACINEFYCSPLAIPYFKIFMIVIITGFITYFVFAGITYLINNYLFKANTSLKKQITYLGINSLFNTLSTIILTILLFISYKLTIIFLFLTSIIYVYNLFRSFEYTTDVEKNKVVIF